MEKVVGLALVAASLVVAVLFVVPKMIDGFTMAGASACSSTAGAASAALAFFPEAFLAFGAGAWS